MNNNLIKNQFITIDGCFNLLKPAYKQDVKLFLNWGGDISNISDPKIWLNDIIIKANSFIDYSQSLGRKPKTLNRYRVSLKSFILKMLGAEYNPTLKAFIDEKFKAEVKHFKVDNKNIGFLTRYEVDKLINESDHRTGLIIKTFFFTGLRCSELCNLLIASCKNENSFIKISYIGKRNKESFCYLPEDIFKDILETFKGNKYLFETLPRKERKGQIKKDNRYYRQNIYTLIKQAGKKILAKDIYPHELRHSSATYLLNQRNLSIYTVKEFLHHESIKTTEKYLHGALNPLSLFDVQGAFI